MTELHLYERKSRLLAGGLVLALLFLLTLFVLLDGPSTSSAFRLLRRPWVFYPLMGLAALMFACWVGFVVWRLFKPSPLVSLTGQGVSTGGFTGRFTAPWCAVQGLDVNEATPKLQVLLLKDPQAFVAEQPKGRRAETARVLTQKFGSPFVLDFKLLDADPKVVAQFIVNQLAKA